tara:strand:- start:48 stop:605 length:558 start_codon:yes stop_codon:yes gene_type:complete
MSAFNVEAVGQSAQNFAQSEVAAQGAVEQMAVVLGQKPSFELWEAAFKVWSTAYADSAKCSAETALRASSRFCKRLNETYGVTKPKATSIKAVELDAKRKAEAEAADNWAAENGQDLKVMKKSAAKMYAAGNTAGFKVAELAIKLIEKESKALSVDAVKDLKEELRKLMKAASAAQLQAAIKALK